MTAEQLEREPDERVWGSPAQREAVEFAIACLREQTAARVARFAKWDRPWVHARDAARFWGVDERTVYRWRRSLREGTGS